MTIDLNSLPPLIAPAELRALLDQGADLRLIDVRTPAEHAAVHISGTYNVPLQVLPEHAAEIRARVDRPVILVCQSGARARQAEMALRAAGLPQLHILDGGTQGWVAAGLPVIRGRPVMSVERQVRIVAGTFVAAGALLALLVDPRFALIPLVMGSGLVFAGVSNFCTLGILLGRMPWNTPPGCDPAAAVRAL